MEATGHHADYLRRQGYTTDELLELAALQAFKAELIEKAK